MPAGILDALGASDVLPATMLSRIFSLIRTAISWSYLGVVFFVFVPLMLVLWPSRRLRICAFNVFGRLIGRVMAFFAGAALPGSIRARVRPTHPAIYLFNHTSYLDNFIASWAMPVGTLGMAQSGAVWVPFFGQLYALSGQVLVKREDRRAAAGALRTMIDLIIAHGFSAAIWPEGGRAQDGRLQPFKRGFVHLALATRLPIVPVVISGAHRCWPKGSLFTRFARVEVQILEPIRTDHWTAKSADVHIAEVWNRFAAALPADQKPPSEPSAVSR